jgi:hypothetical protein
MQETNYIYCQYYIYIYISKRLIMYKRKRSFLRKKLPMPSLSGDIISLMEDVRKAVTLLLLLLLFCFMHNYQLAHCVWLRNT